MELRAGQIWQRKKSSLDLLIILLSQEPGRPWLCAEFYEYGGADTTAYTDEEIQTCNYLGNIKERIWEL